MSLFQVKQVSLTQSAPEGPRPVIQPLESRVMLAAPWSDVARLVGQDAAAARFRKTVGKGETIAVIDTGVDYNHPKLGRGWGRRVIGGYDFVNNDPDPMDETGHGTSVAGVLIAKGFEYGGRLYRGIAPGAKIVALRVEDNSDFVPSSRIEKALRWVLKHRKRFNITAINMSFGEGSYGTKTSVPPYSDELAKLRQAGVFLAAASGNDGIGRQEISYPSADPNVVSVGSVNSRDVISSFTSRGRALELLAPGEGVAAPSYDASKRRHTYVQGSGTSFAVPMVVGLSALLRQTNRTLSPSDILRILKESSTPNRDGDAENPSTGLVFSRINIDDAIARAKTYGGQRARRAHLEFKARKIKPSPDPSRPAAMAAMSQGVSPFNSSALVQPVGASASLLGDGMTGRIADLMGGKDPSAPFSV